MGNLIMFILLALSIVLCIAVGIGLVLAAIFVGQFIYCSIRSILEPGYSERRLERLKKEQRDLKEKLDGTKWPKIRFPSWIAGGHEWKYYAKRNGTYPRDAD